MISTLAWVPKGVPKAVPEPAPPTEEELEAMRQAAARAAQAALRRGNRTQKQGGSSEEEDDEDDESDESMSDDDADDDPNAVARAKRAAAMLASNGKGGGKLSSSARGGGGGGSAPPQTIEEALRDLDMRFPEDGEADEDAARAALIGRAFRTVADGSAEGDDDDGAVEDDDQEANDDDDQEDSEDADAFVIRPSDMLILAGRHEDDVSSLEVWLYEEASAETGGEANLYVHHDLLLPSFPLCAARVDLRAAAAAASGGGAHGNLVAVGTMEPGIDVWDLDVMDAVEPMVMLGGYTKPRSAQAAAEEAAAAEAEEDDEDDDDDDEARRKAKKDKKRRKDKDRKKRQKEARRKPELRQGSHEDAVLALSWNALVRNALASGSADHTVKLWDLAAAGGESSSGGCTATLTHHRGKVQAVAWNPAEAPVLLTGAFDRTACVVDARAPSGGKGSSKAPPTWQTSADVEAVAWNPCSPTSFVVSSEDGLVVCFDARTGAGSKPLWRLSAHDKPACALSFCSAAPGLLATASTDKTVKLWDVSGQGAGGGAGASPVAPVATERPNLGAVFAASFCGADAPHLLAMGGAKGSVGVWDVRSVKAVAKRWPELMVGATFLDQDKAAGTKKGRRHGEKKQSGGGSDDDDGGDDDGRDHEEGLSTDEEDD